MIIFQLYMVVCILFLAGKDATSHKLKARIDNDLTLIRIQRFHRDGAALNILLTLPLICLDPINWWKYILYTIILRLIIFDVSFNYWAGLNYRFLGSTSWWDRQFIKIFGKYGAIKKSLIFLIILIISNILWQQ